MPGEPFPPAAMAGTGQLRLNFSHSSPSQADTGLAILARLVRYCN